MRKYLYIVLSLIVLFVCSCKQNSDSVGWGVLDESESIVVGKDTFPFGSSMVVFDSILSAPDSLLLGEIQTDYGTVRGEILTQLACPEGFRLPDNSEVDSVFLFLSYGSWAGDGNSALSVDVYEMDRRTLSMYKVYNTNPDVSEYCSLEDSTRLLANHRLVVASDKLDSVANSSGTYIPVVRCRLNDSFARRLNAIRSFDSQDDFNKQLKGLYIKTSFGGSTMLNVTDIALGVYYHHTYKKTGSLQDTTVVDFKGFYANSEVRTINRFVSYGADRLLAFLQQDDPEHNYIISPAGVYTRVSLPMVEMASKIANSLIRNSGDTLRPYINLAQLRFEVDNVATTTGGVDSWLQPSPYMLLIREQSKDRFFRNRELPSDTCAILGALTSGLDSVGNTIYYYSYDLSTLLTLQLRQSILEDTLRMVLVPVSVGLSSSSAITSVKQSQTLSATQISSPQSGTRFKVVYSGF